MNAPRSLVAVVGSGLVAVAVACGGDDEAETPVAPSDTAGADGGNGGSSSSSSGGPDGASTPGSACGGTASDPAGAALVEGYLASLPFNAPTGDARAEVIDTVLRTCEVFSPEAPGWEKRFCYAHLVSAILKESSYDTNLTRVDGYGKRSVGGQTANDPVVGLLQIRFSATVRDVAGLARLDQLSCIGCELPEELVERSKESNDSAFWAVTGPTKHMDVMRSRRCNVAMGAWYYYVNATGNGNPQKTTYPFQYCGSATPTAANLVTGLRSHLMGSDNGRGVIANQAGVAALQNTDGASHEYVTHIKQHFDGAIGAVSGTHPFFVLLPPQKPRYCR